MIYSRVQDTLCIVCLLYSSVDEPGIQALRR